MSFPASFYTLRVGLGLVLRIGLGCQYHRAPVTKRHRPGTRDPWPVTRDPRRRPGLKSSTNPSQHLSSHLHRKAHIISTLTGACSSLLPMQTKQISAGTNAAISSMHMWFFLLNRWSFQHNLFILTTTLCLWAKKTYDSFNTTAISEVHFHQFIHTRHFVEPLILAVWCSLKRSTLILKCHVCSRHFDLFLEVHNEKEPLISFSQPWLLYSSIFVEIGHLELW